MTDRLPENIPLAQIARRIREMVRGGCEVEFIDHARKAMADDKLTFEDVLAVLKSCAITEREPGPRYRAEGRTALGEPVVAIVRIREAENGLVVITVWKIQKGVR